MLILHITDSHLTEKWGSTPIGDYSKALGLVPKQDMDVRLDDVLSSFSHLAESLAKDDRKIDLIVHSGDVNSGPQADGVKAFDKILEQLKPVLSDKCDLVVVPGNHDVNRGLRDQPDYYRPITPNFERIVLPPLPGQTGKFREYSLDSDCGVLVLPINSSGYSGSTLELADAELGDASRKRARTRRWLINSSWIKSVIKLPVDAARIGKEQFQQLERNVAKAQEEFKAASGGFSRRLLKIAVLHHHLLPVSLAEEVKPFESLTDLAALRHFLLHHEFDVVLHGHKHEFLLYRDMIPDLTRRSERYHAVSVVSGPPLGYAGLKDPAFLLIDLNPSELAPTMSIQPWMLAHSTAYARPLDRLFSLKRLYPGPSDQDLENGQPVFLAGSVEQVHARSIELLSAVKKGLVGFSGDVSHLICQVEAECNDEVLSRLFEEQRSELSGSFVSTDKSKIERDFTDIVSWWQGSTYGPKFAQRFNHGSRIFDFNESSIDQLRRASDTLNDRTSTKAVITLLNPEEDFVHSEQSPEGRAFPSFCLLQLSVRSGGDTDFLDCTAYFRKQDMRQWWLVNLAEIERIRSGVLQRIREGRVPLQKGRITTITKRAVLANSPLQVSIPKIDRMMADESSRAELATNVTMLASSSAEDRVRSVEALTPLFKELEPPSRFDPDGAPVSGPGIGYLETFLSTVLPISNGKLEVLNESVGQLVAANESYALNPSEEKAFNDWRKVIVPALNRIRESLEALRNESS